MKKNMDNTIRNLINITEDSKLKRLGVTLLNIDESLNIINESLSDIDDDVDMLYDMYFKNDVEKLELTNMIDKTMFVLGNPTDTSILKNPLCVKANELNPCTIYINGTLTHRYPGFYYEPNKQSISLSLRSKAYRYAEDFNGNIKLAYDELPYSQQLLFSKEFKDYRTKASIHHELAHWLDDTFNNQHIKKHVDKRINGTVNKKLENSFMVNHEVYAMLNGIKQIKRKHEDIWDELSFSDVIKLIPSLGSAKTVLNKQQKDIYFKNIQKKMYREGLLGKKMNKSYDSDEW
jgi:hypothetical protein